MTGFDFTAAAALFSYPHNAHRCSTSALKVRRKRYAMPSNNSRPSLRGSVLEVGDERYDAGLIQKLYASDDTR